MRDHARTFDDRNLYVSGVSFNGAEHRLSAANGNSAAINFEWLNPAAAVMVVLL